MCTYMYVLMYMYVYIVTYVHPSVDILVVLCPLHVPNN